MRQQHTRNKAKALEQCLSIMLRMIPQACEQHRLKPAWTHEHDAAIEAAALALFGTDRRRWPPGAQGRSGRLRMMRTRVDVLTLWAVLWLAGIAIAQGFWSTVAAIWFFPWAWYLVVRRMLQLLGVA